MWVKRSQSTKHLVVIINYNKYNNKNLEVSYLRRKPYLEHFFQSPLKSARASFILNPKKKKKKI